MSLSSGYLCVMFKFSRCIALSFLVRLVSATGLLNLIVSNPGHSMNLTETKTSESFHSKWHYENKSISGMCP